MDKAGTLPVIFYDNPQTAKDLSWDTELEMEGLKLVAEGNDNEGNDECSEVVGGNESENNELVGNIQDADDAIQSHVNQSWTEMCAHAQRVLYMCTPLHSGNADAPWGEPKMIETTLKTMWVNWRCLHQCIPECTHRSLILLLYNHIHVQPIHYLICMIIITKISINLRQIICHDLQKGCVY